MAEIQNYTRQYYEPDFTLDEIRPDYDFVETCQGTVPQALEAFFESTGFEDAIRDALSYLDYDLLDITEEFGQKFVRTR